MNKNQNLDEIEIIYKIDEEEIRIFGSKFVSNNKNKWKIIYNNKEYELTEKFKLDNFIDLKGNNLIIKLKGFNNICDMSYMFCECYSLISLPDI